MPLRTQAGLLRGEEHPPNASIIAVRLSLLPLATQEAVTSKPTTGTFFLTFFLFQAGCFPPTLPPTAYFFKT